MLFGVKIVLIFKVMDSCHLLETSMSLPIKGQSERLAASPSTLAAPQLGLFFDCQVFAQLLLSTLAILTTMMGHDCLKLLDADFHSIFVLKPFLFVVSHDGCVICVDALDSHVGQGLVTLQ